MWFEGSNLPIARVPLASLSFDHLLKLATLDEDGCGRALLLLLLGLFLEHLDLVFQAREDETDHGRATVQRIASVQPLVERPDLTLVALELHPLGIAGDLLPLHERRLDLLRELTACGWH